MKKLILIATAAALTLAGCGQTDPCVEAPNPAECRSWSDAGGDVNDYLLYGMAGYMIGSSMSGGSRHTYIYQNPGYRGTYHPTMAAKIGSQRQQIARLERRVQAQKVELRRQQAATRSSSRSSYSSRSSFSGGRR